MSVRGGAGLFRAPRYGCDVLTCAQERPSWTGLPRGWAVRQIDVSVSVSGSGKPVEGHLCTKCKKLKAVHKVLDAQIVESKELMEKLRHCGRLRSWKSNRRMR